jgi:hypothetical protein
MMVRMIQKKEIVDMFVFFNGGQNGRKVVCGSQTGTLLLYTWGCFRDCRYITLNLTNGLVPQPVR